MALTVQPPIVKEHQLIESDDLFGEKGEKTMIKVRQALTGDINIRKDMFANFTRKYGEDDSYEVSQRVALGELERKEVFLTLASCDLETEDGKAYFSFKADGRLKSEKKFNEQWGMLPPVISAEIVKCVRNTTPEWLPEGEA